MTSRVTRGHKARTTLKRKVQILKSIINSKSVKRSMIMKDALIYISKLKLQIDAIKKEIHHLTNNIQDVKVEKLQGSKLSIRVICKMRQKDLLVSIMEEFEKLKINVCHVRVTSFKYFFGLVAIVEAPNDDEIHDAIHDVIDKCTSL